jgi:hypothetical protein
MTGTLKARVGGAWVPILGSGQEAAATARWNTAWGEVYYGEQTSTSVTLSTAPASVLQVDLTGLTIGRKLRITLSSGAGPTVNALNSEIFWGIGDTANTVWRRTRDFNPTSNTKAGPTQLLTYRTTTTAATLSFRLLVWVSASGGTLGYSTAVEPVTVLVEDIGPVTPASIAPPTAGPRVVASGNALGIVAMGGFVASPVSLTANTYVPVTTTISAPLAVGRRYRVIVTCRAVNATAQTFLRIGLYDGTTLLGPGSTPLSYSPTGVYNTVNYQWVIDGDGTTKALNVKISSETYVSTLYADVGSFYIEDVGPNQAPALPIPDTPPGWTTLIYASGWGWAGLTSPLQYRKIGDIVYIRGSAKGPSSGLVGNLPAGFRPPVQVTFPLLCQGGLLGYVYVTTGGDLYFNGPNHNGDEFHCLFSTTP